MKEILLMGTIRETILSRNLRKTMPVLSHFGYESEVMDSVEQVKMTKELPKDEQKRSSDTKSRAAYFRDYYKKNREKYKEYQRRYWEKRLNAEANK